MAGLGGPVGDPAREVVKEPTDPTPPTPQSCFLCGQPLDGAECVCGGELLDGLGAPPAVSPPHEPRFGERLREWLGGWGTKEAWPAAWEVAAAIDQDRDAYRHHLLHLCADQEAEHFRDLRLKTEELVEELRYAWGGAFESDRKDVLDVEPFLERLAGVFGARQEGLKKIKMAEDAKWFEVPGRDGAKGLRVAVNPDGSVGLWPVDPAVGAGFALHAEAARDLETILRAMLPSEFALAAGPTPDPS